MYGGHFDAGIEEGKVLESDGFVGVVADDVIHHVGRGERVGGGEVAGEVEAGGAVVGAVGYVEGVGAGWTGGMLVGVLRVGDGQARKSGVSVGRRKGEGREAYADVPWALGSRMMASSSSSSSSMSGISSSSSSSCANCTSPPSPSVRTSRILAS